MSVEEQETWQNAGGSRVKVYKLADNGEQVPVILKSGQRVTLTPKERQMNQDMAISKEVDFFKNGSLNPVRLVDTAEDYAEIASNPNHLADEDIRKYLNGKVADLRELLERTTNSVTIARIYEMSQEVDVSAAKAKAINEAYDEHYGLPEESIPGGAEF